MVDRVTDSVVLSDEIDESGDELTPTDVLTDYAQC